MHVYVTCHYWVTGVIVLDPPTLEYLVNTLTLGKQGVGGVAVGNLFIIFDVYSGFALRKRKVWLKF